MYTCTHLPVYFKVKITNFKGCKDDHRFRKIYFSLEWPTIFLPTPFSYNYPSFFVYVKFKSIASLLSYSIIMY